MPILSLVTYAIGPSIAKAILKLWLKDQGILPDIIPELFDLLTSAAHSERDARHAASRIEDLGVQVVQQLQPVFDDAGPSLDANGRAAVAQELATTLAAARLQPRLLVECNLDPALLARHLTSVRPGAAKLLSAGEAALYSRLLAESARAITEIATDLQGFDTAYAAASLQDNDKILVMLADVWQRPTQADQEFEDKYRDQVQLRLDRFEPFGLPKMEATTHAQRLTHVYITLQFERHRRLDAGNRVVGDLVAGDKREQLSLFDEPDDLSLTRLPGVTARAERLVAQKGDIDQLLAFSRRLVIRGDAGSGKSTLLQWLAVRSAGRSFTGPLAAWNNAIPFFVRLRERVDRSFPAPEEFIQLIDKNIAGAMPLTWVHRQLDSGRAIVLVDGVDELPQAKREELLLSLAGLVTAYPLARYIVTSRPAALKQDDWPGWSEWTAAEDFTDATLQPLTPDQVNLLIQQWHDALAEKLTDADEIAEIRQLPGALRRTLRLRPVLRRLTTNPLLCSMICVLHRDSRENLPSERRKLYEQCVEVLLTKRDERRKVPLGSEYARLTPGQQLALIQNFAYWMMRNSYSDISVDEADQQFETKLPIVGASSETGEKVRRYFVGRTNLIREPIDGRIDFTHRTFQEYLAAQQAVKENDFGVLINKATEDQWRELVILAAGEARPKEAANFLRRLIKRAQDLRRAPLRHRVLLLAVACLETCVELDPAARAYVIEQAGSLFPPKDDDEARLVSAAGDPAVPLLAYNPQHTTRESVACVRALAQIGTTAAMHAIGAYMSHPNPEVVGAIVDAWDLFDRAEYARHVLAKRDSLIVPLLASWEGFEYLRHLRVLAIVELPSDVDLAPLRLLTSLMAFSIGYNISASEFNTWPSIRRRINQMRRIKQHHPNLTLTEATPNLAPNTVIDLVPISNMAALKHLSLSGDGIHDLTPLATLTGLTQLTLRDTDISDLTPLATLTGLTQLTLRDTDISDLTPLAALTGLTQLTLSSSTIHDLTPLATLTGLTQLALYSADIHDLTPLATLTGLTQLKLSGSTISDLTPLAALTRLTQLTLSSSTISDLTPLAALTRLTPRALSGSTISDLTPLAALTGLTQLTLSGPTIRDLTPLAALTGLTQLTLSGPTIRDLAPLAALTGLTRLTLSDIDIHDLTPLAALTGLTQLALFSAGIRDLTPLAALTGLKNLRLFDNEQLDASQVAKLQTALPQLQISMLD